MKKYFVIISIFFVASLLLTGCNLKEEYAMQYSLINNLSTETKVESTPQGVKLEIPFADFTCNANSVKAVLARSQNTFTVTLAGAETAERCGQRFMAEITGVSKGDYEIKVVYLKGDREQQVLFEPFRVGE